MEVAAAETTVNFTPENMVTSTTPSTIIIEIGEKTTGQANTLTYTVTVNGSDKVEVTGDIAFVTTFTFPETTLSLSFSARQTSFIFSGAVSTEITLPSEHPQPTENGIETHVDRCNRRYCQPP